MTKAATNLWLVVWLAAMTAAPQSPSVACPRCGWRPPQTERTVRVRNVDELMRAVREAKPHTSIVLDDGVYRLEHGLDLKAEGLVLRSRNGDPSRVTIRGAGMEDAGVGVVIWVSAPDVAIADVTVGWVAHHGIQVRGEVHADRVMVHNVRVIDAGQQLLKVSVGAGASADDGTVACSRFEYSTNAPSDYTNGVDLLATRNWVIRDNVFVRVRGPERGQWKAGPAILAWANAQGTLVERNTILDSFRGIALGLGPGASSFARDGEQRIDHEGGIVRNNVVCNSHDWVDESIEANAASGFRIEHNTVYARGVQTRWTIGVRFATGRGTIRNNLLTERIWFRDGGEAAVSNNFMNAEPSWFVNAAGCDLHLAPTAQRVIDAGVPIPDALLDFDRQPRIGLPDLGAFEFRGGLAPGASRSR